MRNPVSEMPPSVSSSSGHETHAPESLEELQRNKNSDDDDGDEHQVVGMQRPEAEQRTA